MVDHPTDIDQRAEPDADPRGESPAQRAARARSFGALARAYADHRPGYPNAAIDWALRPVSGAGRLLDLGAGTGKLTQSLVGRPGIADVTAVEPDPGMLAELRARVAGATAVLGAAEDIPLPDGGMDAVLVGQAFHWFDPERALPEIARVLRPGGVLGVLANRDDGAVEWVAGYYEAVGWARRAGRARGVRPIPEHPAFGPAESAEFANPVPTTVENLLATLGTYSWVSTLPEAQRRATIDRARAYLAGCPELTLGSGEVFELPLLTAVRRLARVDERR